MSGYLATSPYGALSHHKWACDEWRCTRSGGGLGADREEIRAAARAHVEEAGHCVTVFDGTTESLYPVATTAAAGGRAS